jgi:hypothetical protein
MSFVNPQRANNLTSEHAVDATLPRISNLRRSVRMGPVTIGGSDASKAFRPSGKAVVLW